MTPPDAKPGPTPPCCPAAAAAAAPKNAPGLPAIRYRLGTFATFRAAMLAKAGGGTAARGPGAAGDYQTMFVELWAYLADILTFYQERIANEAYLGTATQPESLARLCRLIGARPAPGSAAATLLAFAVEKGKSAVIPAGFRVGKKPAPGEPPVVYETAAALAARGDHSAIPVAAAAKTNQFAKLADYRSAFAAVYPDAPGLLRQSLAAAASAPAGARSPAAAYETRLGLPANVRPVVLAGTTTRLAPGDYVLIVEFDGDTAKKSTVRPLDSVTIDKVSNTTTITWTEESDQVSYAADAAVYAFRVVAGVFGNAAPTWAMLSPTLRNAGAVYARDWDTKDKMVAVGPTISLDGKYPVASRGGWAVLIDPALKKRRPLRVAEAAAVPLTGFTLSATVTQLTLQDPLADASFPMRSTVVLTGAERLALQDDLPLPGKLAGAALTLAGRYDHLAAGQQIVVRGDPVGAGPAAEEAALAGLPTYDKATDTTTLSLTASLAGKYRRAGAVVLANVVAATQGETVKDEPLGSGDGAEFQTFTLRQGPLTYLPATDPEGAATVRDTLAVTVNGVRWDEVPSLFGRPADAREFTAGPDAAGRTAVAFGDGVSGAKPPAGRDNVRARYRRGLGAAGNAPPAAVEQLLDSAPGVQKATNPLPARGGVDPELPDQVRRTAPAGLRPFGRAVSVQDYADLAVGYPGVAQAAAAWVTADPKTGAAVAHPHVRLTVALADQAPLAAEPGFAAALRAFLDARRDPNVPLRIVGADAVYLTLTVRVDVDDRFPRRATVDRVRAALAPRAGGYFAPGRRPLGQTVFLSDVYRAVQAVPGVAGAVVAELRRAAAPAGEAADVAVGPTAVAVLTDDPAKPAEGVLTVQWNAGGFADT